MSRLLAALVGASVPLALLPVASASPAPEADAPPQVVSTASAPDIVRIAAAGDIACDPPYSPTATTCQQAATARLITSRENTTRGIAGGARAG
jgi:hypothetical protein